MNLTDFDPRKQPHGIQTAMAGVMGGLLIWCLFSDLGSALPELLFRDVPLHLLAGAFICVLIMLVSNLTGNRSHKTADGQLSELYALKGWCTEMTDLLGNCKPEPTDQDKVLRAFMLVLMQQRDEVAKQFSAIPTNALSQRQLAMLRTAKCLYHIQTGEFEKVIRIFEQHQAELDAAYESESDYDGAFKPFADDTLIYEMLAAAYCLLMNQPEQAARYREKTAQRASLRPAAEAECFRILTQVQALYASGETGAAQTAETTLTKTVTGLQTPVAPGAKLALRMLTEQANLLMPARLGVRQFQYGERRLPDM